MFAAEELLSSLIFRGDWLKAEEYIQQRATEGSEAGRDMLLLELRKAQEAVAVSVRTVQKSTILALQETDSAVRVISPSLQWAQDARNIYIEVKFAHKWGAPAMTGVKDPEVQFLSRRVRVQAAPPGGDQRFELDLSLYDSLDIKSSSWSIGSAGRLSLTLVKSVPLHWNHLWNPTERAPPTNVKFWFEKQESIKGYDSGWMKSGEDTATSKEMNSSATADPTKGFPESASNAPKQKIESNGTLDTKQATDSPQSQSEKGTTLSKSKSEESRQKKKIDKALKKSLKNLEKKAESKKKQLEKDAEKKKKELEEVQWQKRAALRNEMQSRIEFLGIGRRQKNAQHSNWVAVFDSSIMPSSVQTYLRIKLATDPWLWKNVVIAIFEARTKIRSKQMRVFGATILLFLAGGLSMAYSLFYMRPWQKGNKKAYMKAINLSAKFLFFPLLFLISTGLALFALLLL